MDWAGWGYIEHTAIIPDDSPAEVLTGTSGVLRWPNWCAIPSDEDSFVFIFIVGHAGLSSPGIGYLSIGGPPTPPECRASEQDIADAIASINYGKLVLVIEACYSGSLIDGIVGELGSDRVKNTLIITSSNLDMPSGCLNTAELPKTDDKCTFSSAFLPVLSRGDSFFAAFDEGGKNCYDNFVGLPEVGTAYQDPRLDDFDDNPDTTVGKVKRNSMFPLMIHRDGQLAYVLRLH